MAAAALAGCGGGGDGGGPSLELSVANRDAVSQAAAGGLFAFGALQAVPGAGTPLAAGAGPAGAVARAAALALRAARTAAGPPGRARALAVTGPIAVPCEISGSVDVTFDDRDNNQQLSAGDSVTASFAACVEVAGEMLDGGGSVSFSMVRLQPRIELDARVQVNALKATIAQHAATLNGAVTLALRSPSDTTATERQVADGALNVAIATPTASDTLVLDSGFVSEVTADSVLGRTTTTFQGRMSSTRAGGSFDVVTVAGAPFVSLDADDFPRSGTLRVSGARGMLQMTALSATEVRLELDAGGDGSFEDVKTVAWDWLL